MTAARKLRESVDLHRLRWLYGPPNRLTEYDWAPVSDALVVCSKAEIENTRLGESVDAPLATRTIARFAPGEVVESMLARGVVVPEEAGDSFLITAASNWDARVLALALAVDGDPGRVRENGRTALHSAVHMTASHVRLLLDAGADPLAISLVR